MPLDLLSSCLLFFFLYKVQYFIAILTGLENVPGFPYPYEQNTGAYIGICTIALWSTRRQIWRAFAQRLDETKQRTQKNRCAIEPHFWGIIFVEYSSSIRDARWNGDVDRGAIFRRTFRNDCDSTYTHSSTNRFPDSLNNLYRSAP